MTEMLSLRAIFEGAECFGLTQKEIWPAIDQSLLEVGGDASVSEYLDELAGALARRIVAKERHAISRNRRLSPDDGRIPTEELSDR